jgi:hypothetical protein
VLIATQRLFVLVCFLQFSFLCCKLFFQDVLRILVLCVCELALQQTDFSPANPAIEDLYKQGRPPSRLVVASLLRDTIAQRRYNANNGARKVGFPVKIRCIAAFETMRLRAVIEFKAEE